jgi:hypothetical protein
VQKIHKITTKGSSKAAMSWTAETFLTVTLGLMSVVALLLMTLLSTRVQGGCILFNRPGSILKTTITSILKRIEKKEEKDTELEAEGGGGNGRGV